MTVLDLPNIEINHYMLKKVPCLIVIKPTVCDILQMDFFQRLENILLLLAGLVIYVKYFYNRKSIFILWKKPELVLKVVFG